MSNPAAILAPSGQPSHIEVRWNPPSKGPFFGWTDYAGDPSTVRIDDIVAVVRDQRTNKFVVILRSTQFCPSIQDVDAFRLMRERLNWTSSNPLE
jgi:hypothetical protein